MARRSFSRAVKKECWELAEKIAGRDPDRFRMDKSGSVVCKRLTNCHGCMCHQYDHIVAWSKGGESTIDNCQVLASRVNQIKSNSDNVKLQPLACMHKFTDKELDSIELAVYGDISGNCRSWSFIETQHKLPNCQSTE